MGLLDNAYYKKQPSAAPPVTPDTPPAAPIPSPTTPQDGQTPPPAPLTPVAPGAAAPPGMIDQMLAHLHNWASSLPSLPSGGFNPATPTQMARGLPVISDFDQAPQLQPQTPPTGQTGDGGYWWPRIAGGVLSGIRSGASLPGDVATGRAVPSDPNFAGRTADMANLATLGMGISEPPWQAIKLRTPSDVVGATAEAQKAAETQLGNIRVPSKDLGFTVEGQQNPSIANIQDYQDWLQSQGVTVPPLKPPAAAYTGPTHVYSEDAAGYQQWLKNQAVKAAANAPPAASENLQTAQQRMLTSINRALGQPDVQPAVAAAQIATKRAEMAKTLQNWSDIQGTPGADVRLLAAQQMENYPIGSSEREALKDIAVAKPPERPLLALVQKALPVMATGAGEAASHFSGVPGGATMGAGIAQGLDTALTRLWSPKSVSPVVQQQIAKAYGPLAGQPVETGSPLHRSLMSLYLAARPP